MLYKNKQIPVTNSDLLRYRDFLKEAAESCGVHMLGCIDPQAPEDTDLINIAVGMPLKSVAVNAVRSMYDIMEELVPDNKFYFYASGNASIRNNLTVLYDGKLLYGGNEVKRWNSYIKENAGALVEVARSCGYKIIGTPIADIDEDADLINIAMGMRYKREAEKSIFEARDMIMELLPDCRFYLYAEGVEYIKNNMPVIYDGVLRV